MSTNPAGAASVPREAKAMAVRSAREVPGVRAVFAPVSGIWREITGNPEPDHHSLLIGSRGQGIEASLDIGIDGTANAASVASEVQERIYTALLPHVQRPDAFTVTVTIL